MLEIIQCYWQSFALGFLVGLIVAVALTMTKEYEM